LGSALPLIAIYLYLKFYLNANNSFKVICRTKYRADGRTDDRQTDKTASICLKMYVTLYKSLHEFFLKVSLQLILYLVSKIFCLESICVNGSFLN